MVEEEVDIDRRSMPFADAGMVEPLNPCPKLHRNLLMVEAVPAIDCLEEDTEIFKPFNGVDNQNLCQLLRPCKDFTDKSTAPRLPVQFEAHDILEGILDLTLTNRLGKDVVVPALPIFKITMSGTFDQPPHDLHLKMDWRDKELES